MVERHGGPHSRLLHSIWAGVLPEHYKGYTSPATAALDIALLEQLAEDGPFLVSLQPLKQHTRVALYVRGPKVELGDALPMLEDLGLRVIEEISTRLVGEDETWVQEFRVLGPDGRPLDIDEIGPRVAELLAAVHRGDAETDNLNRLVITAGLDRRQVAILRAYRKYRQRVGSRFTESYQNDVLVANSDGHREARAVLRAALRPGRRDRRGGRGRACATRSSPTSRTSPRSTTTGSCATS